MLQVIITSISCWDGFYGAPTPLKMCSIAYHKNPFDDFLNAFIPFTLQKLLQNLLAIAIKSRYLEKGIETNIWIIWMVFFITMKISERSNLGVLGFDKHFQLI